VSDGERLLSWYRVAARDLPWRRSRDPYRILVSEVMLQQTRVEVVLPAFARFVAAFPSIEALAAADEERVLERWSGLGYYGRARRLREAAREVVRRGGFPRRAAELAQLPGIGSYTAAAVASIAFGEPVAVLDGNVARVIGRWRGELDAASAAGRRRLLAAAETLLVGGESGDSNQALMELGATVCTPRAPRCAVCPLAAGCVARRAADPESYPLRRRRPPPTAVRHLAAVVRDEAGRVLLYRGARGLWEVPQVALGAAASAAAGPVAGGVSAEGALAGRYGGSWRLGAQAATVRHRVTRYALEVAVHGAQLAGDPAPGGCFVEPAAQLAVSSLVRKVLAAFAAAAGEPARAAQLTLGDEPVAR
jgi:A/G-specific adenine glycosylase